MQQLLCFLDFIAGWAHKVYSISEIMSTEPGFVFYLTSIREGMLYNLSIQLKVRNVGNFYRGDF